MGGPGPASEAQEDRVHPFSRMRKEAQRRPRLQTAGPFLPAPPSPGAPTSPLALLPSTCRAGPGRSGGGRGALSRHLLSSSSTPDPAAQASLSWAAGCPRPGSRGSLGGATPTTRETLAAGCQKPSPERPGRGASRGEGKGGRGRCRLLPAEAPPWPAR